MKEFLKNKIYNPILDFLKQGLTPGKLAEGIAWGLVVGFIPILGGTTIICTFVSFARKINMGIIQLIQWLAYPLQILFFLPFLKAGGWLTGTPVPFSLEELQSLVQNKPLEFIKTVAWANLGGVLVWVPVALVVWLASFFIIKHLLKKIQKKNSLTE